MSRFHHYKQNATGPSTRPRVRLYWLNGYEWRGVLLVVGAHEFGIRVGRKR